MQRVFMLSEMGVLTSTLQCNCDTPLFLNFVILFLLSNVILALFDC